MDFRTKTLGPVKKLQPSDLGGFSEICFGDIFTCKRRIENLVRQSVFLVILHTLVGSVSAGNSCVLYLVVTLPIIRYLNSTWN